MVIGESLDERLGETDEETSGEYRVWSARDLALVFFFGVGGRYQVVITMIFFQAMCESGLDVTVEDY